MFPFFCHKDGKSESNKYNIIRVKCHRNLCFPLATFILYLMRFFSSLTRTGNGKIRGQQLLGFVPRCWLPVPLSLHLLPRDRGDQQADRHWPQEHHTQDDRRPLQVQLRQEAVQSDTSQDHVGQRGRGDHPQPSLANKETSHS